ncbi:MAG: hypothetical protein ACM3S1_07255 [Hyphomicrobiales bacterium]
MGIPSLGDLASIYIPKPLAVLELNLSDEWRARFTEADELPENAPLAYGYATLFMGDKGYVTRPESEDAWGVIEGPFNDGETPEQWLERTLWNQAGARAAHTELIGFLDCKATSHNTQFPAGTVVVRPIYLAVAKSVEDVPEGSPYVRRRLPLNETSKAIRTRYPELERYLAKALNRYMVLRARGEA